MSHKIIADNKKKEIALDTIALINEGLRDDPSSGVLDASNPRRSYIELISRVIALTE